MHAWMHTCAHTHTRRQTEGRTDGRTDLHTYRLHTGSRIPHWCMHVDRDVASCCEEEREREIHPNQSTHGGLTFMVWKITSGLDIAPQMQNQENHFDVERF